MAGPGQVDYRCPTGFTPAEAAKAHSGKNRGVASARRETRKTPKDGKWTLVPDTTARYVQVVACECGVEHRIYHEEG